MTDEVRDGDDDGVRRSKDLAEAYARLREYTHAKNVRDRRKQAAAMSSARRYAWEMNGWTIEHGWTQR